MKDANKDVRTCIREPQIVRELTEYLRVMDYNIRLEVPNLGQSADLVATRGRWVTLMEVKVRDWRKAIIQCRTHENVADYICIVLATKAISAVAKKEIEKNGYGLIHYQFSGRFSWVLNPVRNASIWVPQRKVLSSALRKIECEN